VFLYDAPVVTGSQPTIISTVGSSYITLTGYNFGQNGTQFGAVIVSIGGLSCPSINAFRRETQVVCLLPAGAGVQPSNITVNGRLGSFTFAYGAPILSSVAGCNNTAFYTAFCEPDGGQTLTLTGSNFGTSSVSLLLLLDRMLNTDGNVALAIQVQQQARMV
jgi:hypothetical protein